MAGNLWAAARRGGVRRGLAEARRFRFARRSWTLRGLARIRRRNAQNKLVKGTKRRKGFPEERLSAVDKDLLVLVGRI
jgi:hypothetical protein